MLIHCTELFSRWFGAGCCSQRCLENTEVDTLVNGPESFTPDGGAAPTQTPRLALIVPPHPRLRCRPAPLGLFAPELYPAGRDRRCGQVTSSARRRRWTVSGYKRPAIC